MSNAIVSKIRAKLTRAEHHIQDFQLATQAFYDTTPYTVAVREDAQAGKRVYYIDKADILPDALAAIAADAIQNLRSSLDHLAYQLVLHGRSGTEPDWPVYYPIAKGASEYPAWRGGSIKDVRQEVIDAIDATEPYKGGKGHALWQLNELTGSDKHQILVGAGAFYSGVDIAVDIRNMALKLGFGNAKIPDILLRPADKLLPLKVGDELYIEPLDNEVAQDRRFTFDISFNAPGIIEGEPAIKTLKDMSNLVGSIIDTFEPFFT